MHALGALTGNQAVQQVKAGLKAIYLSGWQVAADANLAGADLPGPEPVPGQLGAAGRPPDQQRAAARRPDHLGRVAATRRAPYWLAPIVADAEAGFGGVLNAFELMKSMIAAGAAGVHWEDQLASEKKCGHLGGKVLIPTGQHVKTLNAARLAADVCGVPVADHRPDRRPGRDAADQRRRRAGPAVRDRRADRGGLLPGAQRHRRRASRAAWPTRRTPTCCGWRPPRPTWRWPREFAEAIKAQSTRTRCSPTTARRRSTGGRTWTTRTIAKFQRELAAMGYKFQFITLAGFHALNHSMFSLARGYAEEGMPAYVRLQDAEFAAEARGLHRHQAPARGRHRLLRPGHLGHHPGRVDHGAGRAPPRAEQFAGLVSASTA